LVALVYYLACWLLTATRFDQGDLGGAQRAILWWVGYGYGTVATKEGDTEFRLLLRAVNQYAYADYYTPLLGYCCHNFTDGVAGSEDIINNKNALTWVNAKTSPKSPFCSVYLFGKYATNT
jgi:hypothetical protein